MMSESKVTRTEIEIGGRAAPLVARINRRAKQLILKVDPSLGEIHVTAPSKRALPEAIAFARERESWIASQLDDSLRARPFAPGSLAPVRGVLHRISHDPDQRKPVDQINDTEPELRIGGDSAHLNRRLLDWLKREARADLTCEVDRLCKQLDVRRGAVRIRDTKTRWGSCTSDGVLSFSWRLIMAPSPILTYVAAHECAHLLHMNHSPAFWRRVKSLGVDARAAENWFAAHGPSLFAYGKASRL